MVAVTYAQAPDRAQPQPPQIIPGAPVLRPVLLPDGTLLCLRVNRRTQHLESLSSADGGLSWSAARDETALPHEKMGPGPALCDAEGEVHVILTRQRGSGRPAVTRFIDLWHCRTRDDRTGWTEPREIWRGYCGAAMDVKQLKNGRIVVPFAAWKEPGQEVAPSTGLNYTTAVYSDDRGRTWQLSPSKLTAPCYEGYNGNNYGAIEPTILELADGRVWMLLRTQTGLLYESYSNDGAEWAPAQPSRFRSSTSPAALERLPDGRIVLFWNHCEMPLKFQGAGVYGGRDALHAAISADEGRTWTGYREVYRDPHRDETPPRRGDRGTAYPGATAIDQRRLALATGQGDRRRLILVDTDWIEQGEHADDFADGLAGWHVWKAFGPAEHYWRDRTTGPELVPDPLAPERKVLHLRRPDERDGDCAMWNVPAAARGTVEFSLLPRSGTRGPVAISLCNRFLDPADDRGEAEAVFRLTLEPSGRLAESATLSVGSWHTVTLEWDVAGAQCLVIVDGKPGGRVPLNADSNCGVSYLRLRCLATQADPEGVLVGPVRMQARPHAATTSGNRRPQR